MFRKDWMKVIILILLPINTWAGIFYYLHWQRKKALERRLSEEYLREIASLRLGYISESLNIKVGQRLNYPFPYRSVLIGKSPPFGQGSPILFLNISWIAEREIWESIIKDILKISSNLYVVLLYQPDYKIEKNKIFLNLAPIYKMINHFNHPRLSAIAGEWILTVFGNQFQGTLLILCDGNGIIRAIEPYPPLKTSPYWHEEVADWRPKLHQAVKKVLDSFFRKRSKGSEVTAAILKATAC